MKQRPKQPVRHPRVRRRHLRQLGLAGPAFVRALADHIVGCRAWSRRAGEVSLRSEVATSPSPAGT